MLNISRKNIWYLNQNNLYAFVHHRAFPSDIFNHLLNSELDVEMQARNQGGEFGAFDPPPKYRNIS